MLQARGSGIVGAGAAGEVEARAVAAELEVLLVEHAGEGAGVARAPDPGQTARRDEGRREPDPGLDLGIEGGELGLETGFAHDRDPREGKK